MQVGNSMNIQFKIKIISARQLVVKDPSCYTSVKLGSFQSFKTVAVKSNNPTWDTVFKFVIIPVLLDAKLVISVYQRGFFQKELLGRLEIPVYQLLYSDLLLFDDPQNKAYWYALDNVQNLHHTLFGDIKLKMGFAEPLSKEIRSLFDSFLSKIAPSRMDLPIKQEDSTEEMYPDKRDFDRRESAGLVRAHSSDSVKTDVLDHGSLFGLLIINVIGSLDIPASNHSKLSSKSDLFIIITYKTQTFKAKISKDRNLLNSSSNNRINLYITHFEYDNNAILHYSIFDFESFGRNDPIAISDIGIREVVDNCCHGLELQANKPREFPFVDVDIPLTNATEKKESVKDVKLILNCRFLPCNDARRNFWLQLSLLFDSQQKQVLNKIELLTLLDTIGSSFNEEVVDMLFMNFSKDPDTDSLSYDQIAQALESQLSIIFQNNQQMMADVNKAKMLFMSPTMERLTTLQMCPVCRKSLSSKLNMDVISHLSLCFLEDKAKLEYLMLDGFLIDSILSRRWYSKVINYTSQGNSAFINSHTSIICQDRSSGQLVEEKMPAYVRLGIRLLYQYAGSLDPRHKEFIKNLLNHLTIQQGIRFNDSHSKSLIPSFISFNNISMSEALEPIQSYATFNEFFSRKLNPNARTLSSNEKNVAICPCDGRLSCFQDVSTAMQFWIKGTEFNISRLLQDEILESNFEDGSIAIFRLAPFDYHRFHFPVDGTLEKVYEIPGTYFPVNPVAVKTPIDIYGENKRVVAVIDSDLFGMVVMVCIGSLFKGSININVARGRVSRMQEFGYFLYGGSTILLLFENQSIQFDSDVLDNSEKWIETIVKTGNQFGLVKKL